MSLLLAILFFAMFIGAAVRKSFSYGRIDYDFYEHPVQYIIILLFFLGRAVLSSYVFLVDMDIIK
jgi:hypothetical protein